MNTPERTDAGTNAQQDYVYPLPQEHIVTDYHPEFTPVYDAMKGHDDSDGQK